MTHTRRPILILQDGVGGEVGGVHRARHGTTFPAKAAAGPRTQAR